MPEFGMRLFSARHVSCFPWSSAVGIKVKIETVVLPSIETLSFAFFNGLFPLNQEMEAGGLDPEDLQVTSIDFSAEKDAGLESMPTVRGRTVNENENCFRSE